MYENENNVPEMMQQSCSCVKSAALNRMLKMLMPPYILHLITTMFVRVNSRRQVTLGDPALQKEIRLLQTQETAAVMQTTEIRIK